MSVWEKEEREREREIKCGYNKLLYVNKVKKAEMEKQQGLNAALKQRDQRA